MLECSRFRRIWIAVWLCASLGMVLGTAQAADPMVFDKGLTVSVVDDYAYARGEPGNQAVFQLVFSNTGPARWVDVSLRGDVRLERRFALKAGEKSRRFFYLPTTEGLRQYPSIRLEVGDQWSSESMIRSVGFTLSGTPYGPGVREGTVAFLGRLSVAVNVDKTWQQAPSLDTKSLPDRWFGLVGYDLLVVDVAELDGMLAGERGQLLVDWIASGGVLVVVDDREGDDWLSLRQAHTDPSLRWPLRRESDGFDGELVGLGAVILVSSEAVEEIGPGFFASLGYHGVRGQQRWSSPDLGQRALMENLPEDVTTDPLSLMAVLLLFVAITGAAVGGLLFKRRPLMAVSLAAVLSLSFGGLLIVIELLGRGAVATVSVNRLELLDQASRSRLSFHESVVFAPLASATTVLARPDQALFVSSVGANGSESKTVTITAGPDGQSLTGALNVRSPGFVLSNAILEDAGGLRVLPQDDGASLRVENYLGEDLAILKLWYQGRFYRGESLPSGRALLLSPMNYLGEVNELSPPTALDGPRLRQRAARDLARAVVRGELSPNRYMGRLADDQRGVFPLDPDSKVVTARNDDRWVVGVLPLRGGQ